MLTGWLGGLVDGRMAEAFLLISWHFGGCRHHYITYGCFWSLIFCPLKRRLQLALAHIDLDFLESLGQYSIQHSFPYYQFPFRFLLTAWWCQASEQRLHHSNKWMREKYLLFLAGFLDWRSSLSSTSLSSSRRWWWSIIDSFYHSQKRRRLPACPPARVIYL